MYEREIFLHSEVENMRYAPDMTVTQSTLLTSLNVVSIAEIGHRRAYVSTIIRSYGSNGPHQVLLVN